MSDGWTWLTLEDVLVKQNNRKLVQQGWSPKCHDFPARPGMWGVLKTTAIQPGRFEPEHNKELPEALEPKPQIEVAVGDLLITCAGPRSRCGIPALVRSTPDCLMMSGKMYRIRADDRVNPRFLEYWLLSPGAQKRIDAMKTGISESGLNLTHSRFIRLAVPVPSLSEQHRVVEILDDHLSRLDAAEADLDAAASKRVVLHEQTFLSLLTRLDVPSVPFASVLASGLTNGRSVPTRAGGFPVLRLTALRDGPINLNEKKEGDWTAADAARFLVEGGDFLIARGNGSLRLVGLGGLVGEVVNPVAFPDTLIRARPDEARLSPEYLSVVWNSRVVRRQLEACARTTAGIYKVNQKDLGAVTIPLPSLADQTLLTSAANSARDAIASLAATGDRTRRRGAALRRSLLTAAFSGRLTRDRQHLDTEELVSP